jgi:undecaprenyl diphosphate synthase
MTAKLQAPRHVAIIMDGNGRWARQRGMPRASGHRRGVETLRRIARAARELGIAYLTLYSFSTENWSRPQSEIRELFGLLKLFVRRDLAELHRENVRVRVIGRRDDLPSDILALLQEAERLTWDNDGQTLVIAFNYGGRAELAEAARRLAMQAVSGAIAAQSIDEETMAAALDTAGMPDPDLLIRTSGEKRLSNFLLWQIAYSEIVFVDKLWPDFTREDLVAAIGEYAGRVRRYGGLGEEDGQGASRSAGP